ncbi:MAG: hypothetical protein PHR77_13600 [Kiritimatiellae bacterium]|nr:hypothetical protein [Kiritimatiellia bacterium]MDD5520741.1 hypothetical protein [Kiritimatiellia bacterium]
MKKQRKGIDKVVTRLGLYGDLVSSDEVKTLERFEKLKGQKDWCRRFKKTGYFGTGPEDPSVDAQRVCRKLSEINDELKKLSPRVKGIQTRADKQTRKIWTTGKAALVENKKTGKLTVTLNKENTRNLLFTARMVHVEPERLLNRWFIRDILRGMRLGDLRGLIDAIVYESTDEAACVMRDMIEWEKKRRLPGAGKGFKFPSVKGMADAKASA